MSKVNSIVSFLIEVSINVENQEEQVERYQFVGINVVVIGYSVDVYYEDSRCNYFGEEYVSVGYEGSRISVEDISGGSIIGNCVNVSIIFEYVDSRFVVVVNDSSISYSFKDLSKGVNREFLLWVVMENIVCKCDGWVDVVVVFIRDVDIEYDFDVIIMLVFKFFRLVFMGFGRFIFIFRRWIGIFFFCYCLE